MWSTVLERIEELKNINRDCIGMGVGNHRYQFGPKLSLEEIKIHESKFGTEFPEALRLMYMECGNGGCGPDWGIRTIEELVPYRPEQNFPGFDYYIQNSALDSNCSGMIGFMDRYYAHEACIVTNGPHSGRILEYISDSESMWLGAVDLPTLYHKWLDSELEKFNQLKRTILANPDINALMAVYGSKIRDPVYLLPTLASLLRLDALDKKYSDWHFDMIISEQLPDGNIRYSLGVENESIFNTGIREFISDESRRALSITYQQFTRMKFLVVDVDYRGNNGYVAGIIFSDWGEHRKYYKSVVKDVEEYVSGNFYKRELPCIQALLKEHNLTPDCIVVDGFVYLQGDKPGLGKHLFDSLNGKIPVIGVAKNPMEGTDKKYEVLRGTSTKPLFVTSVGIELDLAKNIVENFEGPHRIPAELRRVDQLCREK